MAPVFSVDYKTTFHCKEGSVYVYLFGHTESYSVEGVVFITHSPSLSLFIFFSPFLFDPVFYFVVILHKAIHQG